MSNMWNCYCVGEHECLQCKVPRVSRVIASSKTMRVNCLLLLVYTSHTWGIWTWNRWCYPSPLIIFVDFVLCSSFAVVTMLGAAVEVYSVLHLSSLGLVSLNHMSKAALQLHKSWNFFTVKLFGFFCNKCMFVSKLVSKECLNLQVHICLKVWRAWWCFSIGVFFHQAYTRAGGFEVTWSMLWYPQRVNLRLQVGDALACISSWVLEVANAQRKCIFCRCFKILGVGREQVVGGSKAREDDNIQHPLQESQDSSWISGH